MLLDYDEQRLPGLSAFRRACLDSDVAQMASIAANRPAWYANENPEGLPFECLATVFRAQHFASENDTANLEALMVDQPRVVNEPWTNQRWLPITQAAWAGHREAVELLLRHGADPTCKVGDPGDESDAAGMARANGHIELAEWLETRGKRG